MLGWDRVSHLPPWLGRYRAEVGSGVQSSSPEALQQSLRLNPSTPTPPPQIPASYLPGAQGDPEPFRRTQLLHPGIGEADSPIRALALCSGMGQLVGRDFRVPSLE